MGSDSLIKNIINQKGLYPLVTEVSMGEGPSYVNDVKTITISGAMNNHWNGNG